MMSGVVMSRSGRPGEGGRLELMPSGDDLAQLLNQSVRLDRTCKGAGRPGSRSRRSRARCSAWCEAGVLCCERQHVGKFCGQHPLRLAEPVPGRGLDPEQGGRIACLVVL
jgi:hypothetical protein